MNLEGKNAIIYGGGGSMGGAIAKTLAEAGARIHLVGRTLETLEFVAREIRLGKGEAISTVFDAVDTTAVQNHALEVKEKFGSVDISLCAIDYQVVQNMPLTEISVDDFVRPVELAMRAQFITATAAARIMTTQGSGMILTITATPGGIGYPFTGGFAPACAAIESLVRNLASEAGPKGVRVVNIRSAGTPDSRVFRQALAENPEVVAPTLDAMTMDTMLKHMPLMKQVADTALFLCSALASGITGVTIDVTAGTTGGFNYKVPRA